MPRLVGGARGQLGSEPAGPEAGEFAETCITSTYPSCSWAVTFQSGAGSETKSAIADGAPLNPNIEAIVHAKAGWGKQPRSGTPCASNWRMQSTRKCVLFHETA